MGLCLFIEKEGFNPKVGNCAKYKKYIIFTFEQILSF